MAYWLQVQTMTDRERRRFDDAITREPDTSGPARPPGLTPGAELLAGMMRKGGL